MKKRSRKIVIKEKKPNFFKYIFARNPKGKKGYAEIKIVYNIIFDELQPYLKDRIPFAYITQFYPYSKSSVETDYGKGKGVTMLNKIENHIKLMGIETIVCYAKSEKSEFFFKKHGFIPLISNYYMKSLSSSLTSDRL